MSGGVTRVTSISPERAAPASASIASSKTFRETFERLLATADPAARRTPHVPSVATADTTALELQARVYREAERAELISKLVDHTVGAVKTILQTRL
jgi:hypothetical protein